MYIHKCLSGLHSFGNTRPNLCRHQPVEQNAFVVRSPAFEAAKLKHLVVTAEPSGGAERGAYVY